MFPCSHIVTIPVTRCIVIRGNFVFSLLKKASTFLFSLQVNTLYESTFSLLFPPWMQRLLHNIVHNMMKSNSKTNRWLVNFVSHYDSLSFPLQVDLIKEINSIFAVCGEFIQQPYELIESVK